MHPDSCIDEKPKAFTPKPGLGVGIGDAMMWLHITTFDEGHVHIQRVTLNEEEAQSLRRALDAFLDPA